MNIDMSTAAKRFAIALSFPGEWRARVEAIAARLAARVGRARVLYDRYHEAEFARPSLDVYLQGLYHDETELNVVFLCKEYAQKEWCGLEWRAIRDLIKHHREDVMLLRFDDATVVGVFSIDGYIDITSRPDEEVAALILERHAQHYSPAPQHTRQHHEFPELLQLEEYGDSVYDYAFSNDTPRALTGSRDSALRLWNLQTGKCKRLYAGHTRAVECVVWSPDQQYALSGSDDKTIRVWELGTGCCIRTLSGHTDDVWAVAWSHDQHYACSGGGDCSIRLWNLDTGNCTNVLQGHTGCVACVEWSNDQSHVLVR